MPNNYKNAIFQTLGDSTFAILGWHAKWRIVNRVDQNKIKYLEVKKKWWNQRIVDCQSHPISVGAVDCRIEEYSTCVWNVDLTLKNSLWPNWNSWILISGELYLCTFFFTLKNSIRNFRKLWNTYMRKCYYFLKIQLWNFGIYYCTVIPFEQK